MESAADKRVQELSGKHKASGKVLMEEVTIPEKTAVQGEARKNTGLEAAEMLALRFHLANELAYYCFMDAARSPETPGLETLWTLFFVFVCISSPCPQVHGVAQKALPEYLHTQFTVLQDSHTEFGGHTVFIAHDDKPHALFSETNNVTP